MLGSPTIKKIIIIKNYTAQKPSQIINVYFVQILLIRAVVCLLNFLFLYFLGIKTSCYFHVSSWFDTLLSMTNNVIFIILGLGKTEMMWGKLWEGWLQELPCLRMTWWDLSVWLHLSLCCKAFLPSDEMGGWLCRDFVLGNAFFCFHPQKVLNWN